MENINDNIIENSNEELQIEEKSIDSEQSNEVSVASTNTNISSTGTLPKALGANQVVYSKSEEWLNRITHLCGAVFAVIASILMLIKIFDVKMGVLPIVSIFLFSLSMINLYVMSTLYHWQPVGKVRRAVFRRFDHCGVALLIAGTYAPFMLIGLAGSGLQSDFIWGIVIASVVLAMAILVVIFNAINVNKFKIFCMAAYVIMGWACVIRIAPLFRAIGGAAFALLLAGGITYTVGIIFYRIKRIKFNHAIWHFFVLGGTVLHFLAIYLYLIV